MHTIAYHLVKRIHRTLTKFMHNALTSQVRTHLRPTPVLAALDQIASVRLPEEEHQAQVSESIVNTNTDATAIINKRTKTNTNTDSSDATTTTSIYTTTCIKNSANINCNYICAEPKY